MITLFDSDLENKNFNELIKIAESFRDNGGFKRDALIYMSGTIERILLNRIDTFGLKELSILCNKMGDVRFYFLYNEMLRKLDDKSSTIRLRYVYPYYLDVENLMSELDIWIHNKKLTNLTGSMGGLIYPAIKLILKRTNTQEANKFAKDLLRRKSVHSCLLLTRKDIEFEYKIKALKFIESLDSHESIEMQFNKNELMRINPMSRVKTIGALVRGAASYRKERINLNITKDELKELLFPCMSSAKPKQIDRIFTAYDVYYKHMKEKGY